MSFYPIYMVSLPRSGSTLLTHMLDQYEDILCLPESFFPAVLELVDDQEWKDPKWMAALFMVSCSDGSPLSLEEAQRCIRETKPATIDALASAVAVKSARDPGLLRTVVWKSTRMVGCWHFAASTAGRFILLKRNPLNVYESQFRVPFGAKNQNPARFALFAASYAVAFAAYPADLVRHLDYAGIPAALDPLLRWLGSSGVRRLPAAGGMGDISGQHPWHAGIDKPFSNDDARKLENLTAWRIACFRCAWAVLALLPFVARKARAIADQRQMAALRVQARQLIQDTGSRADDSHE